MGKKVTSIMLSTEELELLEYLKGKIKITSSAIITAALALTLDQNLTKDIETLKSTGTINNNVSVSIENELLAAIKEKLEIAKLSDSLKKDKYKSMYSLSRYVVVALRKLKDKCEL